MTRYHDDPDDLVFTIRALEERIRALETSPQSFAGDSLEDEYIAVSRILSESVIGSVSLHLSGTFPERVLSGHVIGIPSVSLTGTFPERISSGHIIGMPSIAGGGIVIAPTSHSNSAFMKAPVVTATGIDFVITPQAIISEGNFGIGAKFGSAEYGTDTYGGASLEPVLTNTEAPAASGSLLDTTDETWS